VRATWWRQSRRLAASRSIPSIPTLATTHGYERTRMPRCSRGCLRRSGSKNFTQRREGRTQRAQRENHMTMRGRASLFLGVLGFFAPLREMPLDASEPWATYRGNLQRTGNTDGIAGPATPKVLWAHRSQEHFITAPVPTADRVFISGLGAF